MSRDRARRLPVLLLVPSQPVTKHAPSNNAASLAPVVRSVGIRLSSLFVREAIVVSLGCLMSEVFQTIPLRSGLGVDVDLIIHGDEFREVSEVDFLLVELLAVEARELDIVEWPVKLNAFAGSDLA